MAGRGLPVRQVGEVAGRRGTGAPAARRDRPGRRGQLEQDGRGLVLDPAGRGQPGRAGRRGLGADQQGPGRADLPPVRARRVHLPDEVGLGGRRRGGQRARRPARPAARRDHRPGRGPQADRGRRPGDRDDEGQAPDGRRPEGAEGHRMVAIPRLVIAAPASGCGKTTVACGLMAALRARGLAVSGHKVGPDYIDPGYHALATGRPPRNLDPFLCGEDLIAPLFRHGAAGAQVAVVEGVMGLFDGLDPAAEPGLDPDFGSTAHVARLLRAPVVLVVDAARAGRSAAALAAGFAAFDPRTRVHGVILNRVASDRHERLIRGALAESGMPVYGAIRRTEGIVTPSRHLGLIPAAEREALAGQAIDRMGALIAGSCDLDALLALATRAPALAGPPWEPPQTPPAPHRSSPWPAGRPSRSATASRPNCSRRPEPGWPRSTRCETRTYP